MPYFKCEIASTKGTDEIQIDFNSDAELKQFVGELLEASFMAAVLRNAETLSKPEKNDGKTTIILGDLTED